MSYGVRINEDLAGPKDLDLGSLDLQSCPGFFRYKDDGYNDGHIGVEEHDARWSNRGQEEFQADLVKLQAAGVRGEVITDMASSWDDYGAIWKYRLTDTGVDSFSGKVVFPDDPEEKDDNHPGLMPVSMTELRPEQRAKIVQLLNVFNPHYTLSEDLESIHYGDGYDPITDKDALRDLQQWIDKEETAIANAKAFLENLDRYYVFDPDLVMYIQDNQDEIPEQYEDAEALLADTVTMAKIQERYDTYTENVRWDEAAHQALQEALTNGRN